MSSQLDTNIKPYVDSLLEKKKNVSELGESNIIIPLNEYIEKELVLLTNEVNNLKKEEVTWDELNNLFIKEIKPKF